LGVVTTRGHWETQKRKEEEKKRRVTGTSFREPPTPQMGRGPPGTVLKEAAAEQRGV